MALLLGAIGDDFTGSTDLALMLCKNGMPTVQYIGVPKDSRSAVSAPAAVVALKSRTVKVEQAVTQSVAACKWLVSQGAEQIFFKYCSTFDSTEAGNIGPVAEALLDVLEDQATIVCPSFPANARTVYQGHLFVGDRLLNESSMRHHPLTPMTDANLVRFLGKQVNISESVGLIPFQTVQKGPEAIRSEISNLSRQHRRFLVIDALTDRHLMDIGCACRDFKLITGGSGVAMGLPENFRKTGRMIQTDGFEIIPRTEGSAAIISGSCSEMTRRQVTYMADRIPTLKIDPLDLFEQKQSPENVVAWAEEHIEKGPVLIYSSDEPQNVTKVQDRLGRDEAGRIVETALASIVRTLRDQGIRKFVIAGGETSGAAVEALGISALHIGPEIEPGVPWTVSRQPPKVCIALKSGNFGKEDFFEKALNMLP